MADGRKLVLRADVAQLVEHSLGKGEVISSILIIGSRVLLCIRALFVSGHDFSRAVRCHIRSGFSR
jgi:hypothetical protein